MRRQHQQSRLVRTQKDRWNTSWKRTYLPGIRLLLDKTKSSSSPRATWWGHSSWLGWFRQNCNQTWSVQNQLGQIINICLLRKSEVPGLVSGIKNENFKKSKKNSLDFKMKLKVFYLFFEINFLQALKERQAEPEPFF